ncbi:MAG: hypothetical protein SPI77_01760 [Corynebacterium sp.]|nr:hypothetical protein [Corynebacterium sp.]
MANPNFTDVNRRAFSVYELNKDGVHVLAVDRVYEDGTSKRVMLLNKYDAKKLSSACELYLQQIFSEQFTSSNLSLSPDEMAALFGTDDE